MVLNKTKFSYPIYKNTTSEYKNIIHGYDSSKYLTKTFTSKTKQHIKTRDRTKNKKQKKNTNKMDNNIANIELNISNTTYDDMSVKKLSDSLHQKYCNVSNLTLSSFIDLDTKINLDDWVMI
jgi:hypothetical protein